MTSDLTLLINNWTPPHCIISGARRSSTLGPQRPLAMCCDLPGLSLQQPSDRSTVGVDGQTGDSVAATVSLSLVSSLVVVILMHRYL